MASGLKRGTLRLLVFSRCPNYHTNAVDRPVSGPSEVLQDRCNDRRRQPLQVIKSFRPIRLNLGDRRLGNDPVAEAT